ncbi:MAG TPA: hypothetical protein VF667_06255 [Pseudonocardia sp.]
MTAFECRRTGRTYDVGPRLDDDGRAAVHAVEPASSGLALKQYAPETLQRRSDLEGRVKAMIAAPPAHRDGPAGSVLCAWPEDAAYVEGRFVGFVMPRVDTAGARTVQDVATAADTTWRERVLVAEGLTRAVAVLHDAGVVVGDFRDSNLLAWPDGRVTLLGCDRMQVEDPVSGGRFACVADRNAATPPELLAAISSAPRTPSSDAFALAVLLHLLLLPGAHPFRGRWRGPGDEPAEQELMRAGLWSYAGDGRLEPQPGSPPLDVLPETLQRYFRAAFVDGARHPYDRPSAREWLAALVGLRASTVSCGRDPRHAFGRHLRGCPWCAPGGRPAPPARAVPAGYHSRRPAPSTGAPPGPRTPAAPHRAAAAVGTRSTPPPTRPDTSPPTLADAPAPTRPDTAPPTRRLAPHRPAGRQALRAAAVWAAVLAVATAGVVALAAATRPSRPAVPDPTVAAATRTNPAPAPTTRPSDPTAALESLRAQDAPAVERLAESWVAQLATLPAAAAPDRADAAVLAGHDRLRAQHPGAVLLRSPGWNFGGDYWVTVMATPFPSAEAANAWCDTNRFAGQDCFAKKLSHSGPVDGSARYRR